MFGRGVFGSALSKSARRVSKYPATSTIMIMVATPVSVVTHPLAAGEVAIVRPAAPAIKLLKAL
jgi:hypothetical protein